MRKQVPVVVLIVCLLLPSSALAVGMMERLAEKIVRRSDSYDQKMRKIEDWVRENIEYVSDRELYGRDEASYHPSVTIRKGKADCEDGALLTQSLAAYAGIPLENIRTIIGMIQVGGKRSGHAWTLYKREQDGAWVVVDWTRKAKAQSMSRRPPLFLAPIYREYQILAYVFIRAKRPFRASYVQVTGDVPISGLGTPGELDRLLTR